MVVLHQLSDFLDANSKIPVSPPSYYYEGSAKGGEMLRLPRTALVEAIAYNLMEHLRENPLYSREGKMYGVLLVELPTGEQRVIKAFSGLLHGCSVVEGWVPPIPGRDQVVLEEARTLTELETIKQKLITLKNLPERLEYQILASEFKQQLQSMCDRHRDCKQQRHSKRQQLCQTLTGEALTIALEQLDAESRQQGIERRHLKSQQNCILQPLQQQITAADKQIRELKQQRQALSRRLQAEMHAAYSLTNFSGQSLSLQQLMPGGLPTGTGDCCAPKLLHYGATYNLKPLAMAEFWWGASSLNRDKIQGEFYGACVERCQPLMGFLLSGLKPHPPTWEGLWGEVPIIYEDEWLIAVNKPPGLLSVPGRYRHNQDSILSRLRHLLPHGMAITSVHRLDQETSGILLLARDNLTHHQLSLQFQQRQIHKVYEAILAGAVATDKGVIELPLWGNPENRPYQQVDEERGKPSLTHFRVMRPEGEYSRVELTPITGRTHQLRVHAADQRGLGVTILGDRLYGCNAVANRLYLHARELSFHHPQSGENLHLQIETPF
ncbi:RluA family pseudouridine synthase [Cylindrospermum sp. FACHB-282]|uniref:RluA family pseudouridine synthase n=1 Tax=Cylindrospermum sp. FACHB-282 TaxID=2692794 RepID=UPI0016838D82|nr:RluA family pseudouridine synthase [Cylindrospermum sp. FACHB-282]MBD2387534.1 RluA family pseudouridine synthase [Cylindrospermum sp. FACHB-282]